MVKFLTDANMSQIRDDILKSDHWLGVECNINRSILDHEQLCIYWAKPHCHPLKDTEWINPLYQHKLIDLGPKGRLHYIDGKHA